jgi:arabinan endo-1,5-alpha-L-arabinosidase
MVRTPGIVLTQRSLSERSSAALAKLTGIAVLSALLSAPAHAQTPAAVPPPADQPLQGPPIGVPVLGMPTVHDPSTVVRYHGRYYVYATGRGAPFLSSPDGHTWTREGSVFQQVPDSVHAIVPRNNGTDIWAPDVIRVNGQFLLYYAVSSWGSFNSAIGLATNTTLDPKDPAYKWVDRGVVVSSDGKEDLNAIDPGVILAPGGTLWLCYGSYHGSIRITQLDPRTGLPLKPRKIGESVVAARESEASDIIYHDGFYYLFVNHGSCCKGKDSQYNIRVGRSRTITGPYLDKHGEPLAKGGGSLFLAAHDHRIGPGHFGRVLDYDASPTGAEPDGVERFSLHYEADSTNNNRPTLDIRPLLWSTDGWPVAGDNLPEATYQVISRASENTLAENIPAPPKPADSAATSATATPTLRVTRYLTLANEKWSITPAPVGFYKIVNVATGDAIGMVAAAYAGPTPIQLSPYIGADTQLWQLEQLPDSSYILRNKATGLTLIEAPKGAVIASPFTHDDQHLWSITTP